MVNFIYNNTVWETKKFNVKYCVKPEYWYEGNLYIDGHCVKMIKSNTLSQLRKDIKSFVESDEGRKVLEKIKISKN